MNQEKSEKSRSGRNGSQTQTIAGAEVSISKAGDQERLLIDGKPMKFHKTDAGYLLNANMFAEPQPTLLDAVKLYLKRAR